MSPWRMMNEWGVPSFELHSLLYKYAERLSKSGRYVPPLVLAGGFTFEDQIFKGLAMGAPYVKLIGMARSPLAAVMVGKTIGRAIDANQLPVYVEKPGWHAGWSARRVPVAPRFGGLSRCWPG